MPTKKKPIQPEKVSGPTHHIGKALDSGQGLDPAIASWAKSVGLSDDDIATLGPNDTDYILGAWTTSFIQSLQTTHMHETANTDSLGQWQDALAKWNGGPVAANRGYIDGPTQNATAKVLEFAHDNGIQNPWVALDIMTKNAQDQQMQQLKRQMAFQPMADVHLNTAIDSAFSNALGRAPEPHELQKFKDEYRNAERKHYNQQIANAASSTGGGTIEQLGSPTEMAYQELLQSNPEAMGYGARQAALDLNRFIGV